jgi:predicted nuclease of predicted toxin-antitoxin system
VRFLADENIPRAVVDALSKRGHDVAMISEVNRGAEDHRIVALAEGDRRTLLTFDKDFGEIAFRSTRLRNCGVILLRFVPRDPADAVAVVVTAIAMRDDWSGQFAVVERDRVRVRQLESRSRPSDRR